ncbi:hypothetical protein [Frigidibacter mobilis]|nr:hypothetical protein [Frigidibacter mobilis]
MTASQPQFTDRQIAAALAEERRVHIERDAVQEHPDCVRIAIAWLDAQTRLARSHIGVYVPLKHMVEGWGGRYLSTLDLMAGARLLGIRGAYPWLGISRKFVLPDLARLQVIGQALSQPNYCGKHFDYYMRTETGASLRAEVDVYAEQLAAMGRQVAPEALARSLKDGRGFGLGY